MKSNALKYGIVVFFTCVLHLIHVRSFAQNANNNTVVISDTAAVQDSTPPPKSTIVKKDKRPRNAAIMSALLPGLGQAYNKSYWKLPFLYAGIGTLGVFIHKFNSEYKVYKQAYVEVQDNGNPQVVNFVWTIPSVYHGDSLRNISAASLKLQRDFSRRNRDFNVILMSLLYVLNIVDAHVDAHLRTFNVSDDLTLYVDPKFNAGLYGTSNVGLSFSLRFKN